LSARLRWTDDRCDDLAKVVYHNDGRLDTVAEMATESHRELGEIKKTADSRSFSRTQQALITAALLSPVATILAAFLGHH